MAFGDPQYLTAAFAADGGSDTLEWDGSLAGSFSAVGTFGGGTLTLQFRMSSSDAWQSVNTDDLVFTADGGNVFFLPKCQLRILLAGATSPAINAYIAGIPALTAR